MKMMFPKDHVQVFEKIMAGAKEVELNGKRLSSKQITDIRQMINDITENQGTYFIQILDEIFCFKL